METVLVNLMSRVRKVSRSDGQYLVAPMTMIVPGVLNGSQGPLLYPPEEISRNPSAWDGMPITNGHPFLDGQPVSARRPDVLDLYEIGRVFNTRWTNKLVAEGWFNVASMTRISPRVLNALLSGSKVKLSTGLFTTNEPAPDGSIHNGLNGPRPYTYIARNYRPDHLAILLDEEGACSLDDGCGVLANSANGELVTNQPSHDDLRSQLCDLISMRFGPPEGQYGYTDPSSHPYVVDVFDKEVVYSFKDKLWKIRYKTDLRSNKVALSEDPPTEVNKVSSYKEVTSNSTKEPEPDHIVESDSPAPSDSVDLSTNNTSENNMDRNATIDFIVTNCDCWKHQGDRDILSKMTDAKLLSIKMGVEKGIRKDEVLNSAKKGFTDPGGNTHVWNEEKGAWETKTPTHTTSPTTNSSTTTSNTPTNNSNQGNPPIARPLTEQEWLQSAPQSLQNRLKYLETIEQNERTTLINQLTANVQGDDNKRNAITLYSSMGLDQLKTLVSLHPPTQNQGNPQIPTPGTPFYPQVYAPIYPGAGAGVGGQTQTTNKDQNASRFEDEDLDMSPPVVNWNDEEENFHNTRTDNKRRSRAN